MARLSKEDVARLDGLQMALEIVEKGGVDALRDEVKWRCNNRVCPPVKKTICIRFGSRADETGKDVSVLCYGIYTDL